MKSSLKNMVLMLFVIALVCSAAVAGVYELTKEPIAKAQQQKVVDALAEVLPSFDTTSDKEAVGGCFVYEARLGGEIVGYAVETSSPNGFNGNIDLMVGFDVDGTICNVAVLQQAETPGLGANMDSEDNALLASFKGKKASEMNMTVKKDGGDVDALTAATISSRAYSEAVALAYEAFKEVAAEAAKGTFAPEQMFAECDGTAVEMVDGREVVVVLKEQTPIGYIIDGSSEKGFNGLVSVKVGFAPDGTIVDVVVVEQNETPGLGTKMCDEGNVLISSIKGYKVGSVKLALKKDGGDVDALTSATVSSRAYVEAVGGAVELFKKINK